MSDVTIERYEETDEETWNQFVSRSRNATFMFDRSYMDYHSDRFDDHSLLVRRKGDLRAVFPANEDGDALVSHGGLTFGGLLLDQKVKAGKMLEIFEQLQSYADRGGFERIVYKCIPYIYHGVPSSEDRYALYRADAELVGREVTSAVALSGHPPFQKNRRRGIDDAREAGLEVRETEDFETYWNILETNLAEKHGEEPVHTLDEIELLHERFPDNLRLFASFREDEMLAGVVVYESEHVARSQYIANSDAGRDVGALDIVFDHLINTAYADEKRYFDFGVSTEDRGDYINEGLVFFKEGFGARTVVHDFYEIRL